MAHESRITRDRETIMRWVQDREGKPAVINTTKFSDDGSGMLRINFPGFSEEYLKNISWDQFFQIFDEKHLIMVYKDSTGEEKPSHFIRFIQQD